MYIPAASMVKHRLSLHVHYRLCFHLARAAAAGLLYWGMEGSHGSAKCTFPDIGLALARARDSHVGWHRPVSSAQRGLARVSPFLYPFYSDSKVFDNSSVFSFCPSPPSLLSQDGMLRVKLKAKCKPSSGGD